MHLHRLLCTDCGEIKSLQHFLDPDRELLYLSIHAPQYFRYCIQCRSFIWIRVPTTFYNGIEQFLCANCSKFERRSCLHNGSRKFINQTIKTRWRRYPSNNVCKSCADEIYRTCAGRFAQRAITRQKGNAARRQKKLWKYALEQGRRFCSQCDSPDSASLDDLGGQDLNVERALRALELDNADVHGY